jgi:hypothetical protein
LMENQDGWRMNSMVTRWFILPVPTGLLVVVPYAAACLAAGGFLGLWLLLLRRLAPGLDLGHVLWVLMVGMAAVQALAWVVPRRPAQFWPLVGLGLPVMLLVALVPLDNPGTEGFRQGFRRAVPVLLLVLRDHRLRSGADEPLWEVVGGTAARAVVPGVGGRPPGDAGHAFRKVGADLVGCVASVADVSADLGGGVPAGLGEPSLDVVSASAMGRCGLGDADADGADPGADVGGCGCRLGACCSAASRGWVSGHD